MVPWQASVLGGRGEEAACSAGWGSLFVRPCTGLSNRDIIYQFVHSVVTSSQIACTSFFFGSGRLRVTMACVPFRSGNTYRMVCVDCPPSFVESAWPNAKAIDAPRANSCAVCVRAVPFRFPTFFSSFILLRLNISPFCLHSWLPPRNSHALPPSPLPPPIPPPRLNNILCACASVVGGAHGRGAKICPDPRGHVAGPGAHEDSHHGENEAGDGGEWTSWASEWSLVVYRLQLVWAGSVSALHAFLQVVPRVEANARASVRVFHAHVLRMYRPNRLAVKQVSSPPKTNSLAVCVAGSGEADTHICRLRTV